MTSGRWRAARYGTAAVAVLTLATVSACSSGSSSSNGSAKPAASASSTPSSGGSVTSFPRSQTLYTSGTAYSPPTNWNPLDLGNYATGTQGLIYEPLFLYDPIKGTYTPWLASAGTWNGSTYTITVRDGVKWSDGQPFTGADVAYTINMARTNAADPYATNVLTVASATASGNTVAVKFKGTRGTPTGRPSCGRPRSCRSTSGRSCPRPRRSPARTRTRSAPA